MTRRHGIGALGLAIVILFCGAAYGQDKPTIDLKWYGYVKLDAAEDQNLSSHGNYILWVERKTNAADDGQFNMTADQTRLGLKAAVKGIKPLVNAQLELDLYGGVTGASVPENKPIFQMRHAFFTVQSGQFKLLAGQTWDLAAPLNPSTLNYAVLWGCGNIGFRRPQVSFFYAVPAGDSAAVTLAAGLFRVIGGDLTPTGDSTVADGFDDGADAGLPSVQGRLEFEDQSTSGISTRAGVSGLWGKLRAEDKLAAISTEYDSWGLAGHLTASSTSGCGVAVEAFIGSNLSAYYGGILDKDRFNGLKTKGGWGSIWMKPAATVVTTVGMGMDDPDNAGVADAGRTFNRCYFGNVVVTPWPQVSMGLEISHWDTYYRGRGKSDDLRGQTSLMVTF